MECQKAYIEKLAQDYEKISRLEQISDSESDRLDEILEIAESNYYLNNLLNQIDLKFTLEEQFLDKQAIDNIESQRINLIKTIDSKKEKNMPLTLLLF